MNSGEIEFRDYSPESTIERRSLCYNRKALNSLKTNKPLHRVCDMAQEIGRTLLTELEYLHHQNICRVDTKTSSWYTRLKKPGT
jgi:hypothetical protein